MNSLYGLLAAPTAATALDLAGRSAKAAATPFELLMQMAVEAAAPNSSVEESAQGGDEAQSLQEQIARQLQEMLASLGVEAGDRVTIKVDSATGDLSVSDVHPLASEIEAALASDSKLAEDVRRLAEIDGLFGAAPFAANSKLDVEVAEDQSTALLQWR